MLCVYVSVGMFLSVVKFDEIVSFFISVLDSVLIR